MRITRETLLKIATETVAQRVQQNRDIITALLVGSLLSDEPLLGGTTDIDLIFVHASQPLLERELVRLNDEVHLDIAHLPQSAFQQPRQLRVDPWLGSAIYANPLLLHDKQHWFEFTQASVRSQFNRPDYALGRARPFAEQARQTWLKMREEPVDRDPHPAGAVSAYLAILAGAANAVAALSGYPLTERRFLVRFPERALASGNEGLAAGLVNLLGDDLAGAEVMRSWLPEWANAFDEAGRQPSASIRLHPFRKLYYERCLETFLSGERPRSALWLLLRTWTRAVHTLPADSVCLAPWQEACRQLQLGAADLAERLIAADAFLDLCEEALDRWAQENGLS